jgi:pyruvate/2-oxoglutarate dehydrogenase complex dihydrolipoamide acyltransferase (E2) component
LSSAIADAIAANQRPEGMAKDEETVYDFVSELLAAGSVSDAAFQRVKDAFGERGVVDLVGAVGYYSLVSMTLNVFQLELPAGEKAPLATPRASSAAAPKAVAKKAPGRKPGRKNAAAKKPVEKAAGKKTAARKAAGKTPMRGKVGKKPAAKKAPARKKAAKKHR